MSRHAHTVTRAQFYEEVWTTPLVKLARRCGVSDVTLGKLCKRYDIPRPGPGYWTLLAFGKASPRPPLPEHPCASLTIVGDRCAAPAVTAAAASVPPVARFSVPERLTNPHPLIVQTRDIPRRLRGIGW